MREFDSLIDSLDAAWSAYMDPEREDENQRKWQEAFFAGLRKQGFKLSKEAVENYKTIIFCHRTFWADSPLPYLAWFLGNILNEVGPSMRPIKETQKSTETTVADRLVVARLDAWWNSGKAQRFGVRSQYWRATSKFPFGRGYFQTTHHGNYEKSRDIVREVTGVDIPFDEDYNLMLDPLASAIAGFAMSLKGKYTGKALINYWDAATGKFDYKPSRAIVNGDRQKFAAIAEKCRKYEKALAEAEKVVPGFLTKQIAATEEPPAPEEPGLPVPVPPIDVPVDVAALQTEKMVSFVKAITDAGGQVNVNLNVTVSPNFPPAQSE